MLSFHSPLKMCSQIAGAPCLYTYWTLKVNWNKCSFVKISNQPMTQQQINGYRHLNKVMSNC